MTETVLALVGAVLLLYSITVGLHQVYSRVVYGTWLYHPLRLENQILTIKLQESERRQQELETQLSTSQQNLDRLQQAILGRAVPKT